MMNNYLAIYQEETGQIGYEQTTAITGYYTSDFVQWLFNRLSKTEEELDCLYKEKDVMELIIVVMLTEVINADKIL